MTTQRGEDPAAVLPAGDEWFTRPAAGEAVDDAPGDGLDAFRPAAGEGAPTADGIAAVPAPRSGRRRRRADSGEVPAQGSGFDPGDTGTWRVDTVVPGADGGRRHTTILRYLIGLLAVDRLRSLTRWAFAVPVVGLVLLLVKPRWIGLAVLVLGVLAVVGRAVAVRTVARRSLARRYRPVEDDLRAAVEAGKANLRGELTRVGLPTGGWAMPISALMLARGSDRSAARGKLREIEIHRILPEAQLQRALRVLDDAGPAAR